ncbi:hypothetical protein ACFWF3_29910, partial [Nocardia sp. NPDC060220]
AVVLGFLWRRTSAIGVLLGLIAGFTALLAPFAKNYWAAHLPEWEPGLIAMAINAAVVLAVSPLTPKPAKEAVDVGLALTADDCADPWILPVVPSGHIDHITKSFATAMKGSTHVG